MVGIRDGGRRGGLVNSVEVGEGKSFRVVSFRDRLGRAPACAATVSGALCMRVR